MTGPVEVVGAVGVGGAGLVEYAKAAGVAEARAVEVVGAVGVGGAGLVEYAKVAEPAEVCGGTGAAEGRGVLVARSAKEVA